MEKYRNIGKIGEGAFGEVFKGKRLQDGVIVALKKVRIRDPKEGIAKNTMREIEALKKANHSNIVELLDHFPCGGSLVMVFEFMVTDLHQTLQLLADTGRSFSHAAIKCLMIMMLKGMAAVHSRNLIHRDVKPANMLFSPQGVLKLADFGLARVHDRSKDASYSHEVATRWYRAPELLFGARHYNTAVDMWAIGCIFAELLNRAPLFQGENDIDQLYRVQKGLGTPTLQNWPGVDSLPDYHKIQFPKMPPTPFEELLADARPCAIALVKRFLIYDPNKRITAQEALLDPYFFMDPLPLSTQQLAASIPQLTKKQAQGLTPEELARGKPAWPDLDLDAPFCFA